MLTSFDTARLAATILHFAWQGLAIGLIACALMILVRSPRIRYAIGCVGLLAMLAAPIATFAYLAPPPQVIVVTSPTFTASASPRTLTISSASAIAVTFSSPPPTFSDRARIAFAAASPYITVAWIIGVALVTLRHAVGLAAIARLRRGATAVLPDELRQHLTRIAARLNIRRGIALLGSTAIDAPCVIGFLRPAILWPASAITGLSPLQLDALLAHELAHIRRHDYVVNLIQVFVETLGFYHPVVWWLSNRVRQEREHCCDDIAANLIGDRVGYAEALTAIEMIRGGDTLVLSAHGGSLISRVQRLLLPATDASRPRWFGSGAIFATLVLVVAAALWTQASRVRVFSPNVGDSSRFLPAPARPTTQAADYAISPGDLLRVSVSDLAGAGVESAFIKRVANSGIVTLPYLGEIKAAGLSESQFEVAIAKAYEQNQLISHAVVNVLVVEGSDGARVPIALIAPPGTSAMGDPIPEARTDPSTFGTYFVSGIVAKPGAFKLDGQRVSVLQALIAAELPASLPPMSVRVTRRDHEPIVVKASAATGAGEEVFVEAGDTLYVNSLFVPATAPATKPPGKTQP